jgi:lysozyme family protein
MAPTPEQAAAGYKTMFARAKVKPERAAAAKQLAVKIKASRVKCVPVEAATSVPWEWVAITLLRESSLNFSTYLGNGQPLSKRTTIVPKGRGPFRTFADGAIDAIGLHKLDKVPVWSVERMLYEWERWNGWGYLGKTNSPYIWSWTSEYTSGKYVADHDYRASVIDPQPGCAAVFKALIEIDPAVAARVNGMPSEPTAPPDVIKRDTKRERAVRTTGAAGAAAGGGGEAAKQTGTVKADLPVVHPVVTYALIGAGVAAAIIGGVLIARKTGLIKAKWGG